MGKSDGAKGTGPPAGLGDARFAKMYTDPRFQRFPKKKGKVEIDSRFASEKQLMPVCSQTWLLLLLLL
jgi:hypothetical protein